MREKDIEKYLVRVAEDLGGKAYKFNSGIRGVPDRIVLLPGGKISFVEVKAPGETPKALQRKRLEELHNLGFHVAVTDSKEDVIHVMERMIGVNIV